MKYDDVINEIEMNEKGRYFLGIVVEDVSGNSSDGKTCHLSIKSLKQSQLGKWKCQVQLAETPFYLEAFFTATTEIRVSDVRLPKHLQPEKYAVYLTPFIIENNFTTQVS